MKLNLFMDLFYHNLAIGILLLTSMPAAVASHALADTEDKIGKITTTIGAAYMVPSELPWNTLLIPFKKIIVLNNRNVDFQHYYLKMRLVNEF